LIVILGNFVFHPFFAPAALVEDELTFFARIINADGFHQARTRAEAISRDILVDMLGVEALSAVVSTAVGVCRIFKATVLADKAFVLVDEVFFDPHGLGTSK